MRACLKDANAYARAEAHDGYDEETGDDSSDEEAEETKPFYWQERNLANERLVAS